VIESYGTTQAGRWGDHLEQENTDTFCEIRHLFRLTMFYVDIALS
jgi:hypothetical protein